MYFSASFIAAVLPFLAAAASDFAPVIVPGAYIVEFNDATASCSDFFANLTETGVKHTVRQQVSHPKIFNGASFRLHDDHQDLVETINNFDQVKRIWPVRAYARPQVAIPKMQAQVRKVLEKRVAEPYPPHVMGGVDKLHAEGITGKGVKIAIIDTGVDYNHPSLGGGFGPGFKVAFGRDLVGDAYNGANHPVPDADPIDCDGHGSHVAGIIGANANDKYVVGVALDATLGIFKVFGCPGGNAGSAANDVLIDAYVSAYDSGADIITASIGGASGWPEE